MEPRLSRLLCLVAMLLASLTAQADPKFRLSSRFEPVAAGAGDAVQLILTARTAPGWHAYGSMEETNESVSLDPASLELTGLELNGPAVIPPGNPKDTPVGMSYPLGSDFEVVVPLKALGGATVMKVAGELGYQICDATMCLRPTTAAFAAELTVSASAAKQQDPPPALGLKPGLTLEEDKVTIRASFDPAVARAGEVTTLVLDVDVIDGWHAYGTEESGNTPVDFDQLKQDIGDLEFEGEPDIPPGEAMETPVGLSFPLPYHFQVKQVVRIPVATGPGEIEVAGVLDYQVCDEASCDPEAEGEFEAKLTIEPGDARVGMIDAPQPTLSGEAASGPDEANPESGSWWALILMCIGGGLFALAMPCTYPMIPITFSFFTKQAEKRGGNVLPLTIVYGLGIIAMFVFVGVSMSYVIIDVVNHWLTNTIIGAAFFFFAFVLFGWINLTPPQWMNKLAYKAQGSAASDKSSGGGILGALLGVFFMGATLVITSFTCTAPIVGTLIANVAKFGSFRVGVGMAVFGLTMAIPFMMLSLAPGKVKAMPKSGEWMETLKISLGFVELAAAFKFVSMVDFARGWQALPRELFLLLWTVIFGLWAMFLFGILRKAGTPNEGVGNGRMAGGMLVSLLAAYFFFGAMGNRLDAVMTGFIPQYSNSLASKSDGQKTAPSKHSLVKDDPNAAIELAQKEGKLLLYNFTGFN